MVGTFLCLTDLGTQQVYASALPWANGMLDMSHGRYPLPAPAVVRLLQGYPCVSSAAEIELVTPTGAALLTHLVKKPAAPNAFIPLAVGYGAGSRERADNVPNLLRMIRAQADERAGQRETIAVLETEVDDLNPRYLPTFRLCLDHPDVLDFFTHPGLYEKEPARHADYRSDCPYCSR